MARRLYTIKHSEFHCGAGRNADDTRQFLFGQELDRVSCLAFDADGVYLGCEQRPLGDEGKVKAVALWMADLRVTPGSIRVREFFHPDGYIGVRELPNDLVEFLEHPDHFSADDRVEYAEQLKDWRAQGYFVMMWHEEYWMSSSGEVEAT